MTNIPATVGGDKSAWETSGNMFCMRAHASKLFVSAVVAVVVLLAAASGSAGTALQAQEFVETAQEAPAEADEVAEPEVAVTTTAPIITVPTTTTPPTTTTAPGIITSTGGLTLSEWHVLQVAIARNFGRNPQGAWWYNYAEELDAYNEKTSEVKFYVEKSGDLYGCPFPYIEGASIPDEELAAAGCWGPTELEKQFRAAQTICGKGSPPEGQEYWYDLSPEDLEERLFQANAKELARFYADPDGIPLCSTDMFVSDVPVCRHETAINFFNYHKFPNLLADPVYKNPHNVSFTSLPYLSINPYRDRATVENKFHDYCTRLLKHHGETYQRP